MRERLITIGIHVVGEPLMFALATAIGLMARGSERVREDWTFHVINDAYLNYGPNLSQRWSLMFLQPKDRASVYEQMRFVTGS